VRKSIRERLRFGTPADVNEDARAPNKVSSLLSLARQRARPANDISARRNVIEMNHEDHRGAPTQLGNSSRLRFCPRRPFNSLSTIFRFRWRQNAEPALPSLQGQISRLSPCLCDIKRQRSLSLRSPLCSNQREKREMRDEEIKTKR